MQNYGAYAACQTVKMMVFDVTEIRGSGVDKPSASPLSRIVDVARRAGVSTATVDRVLNRRPGVRPITLQRVLTAASELNYMPAEDLLAAMRPKPMRLLFLLPKGTNRFLSCWGS